MDPFTVATLLTLMNEPVDHQPGAATNQQIAVVENLLFSSDEASRGLRADSGIGEILPSVGNASLGAAPATITLHGGNLNGTDGLRRSDNSLFGAAGNALVQKVRTTGLGLEGMNLPAVMKIADGAALNRSLPVVSRGSMANRNSLLMNTGGGSLNRLQSPTNLPAVNLPAVNLPAVAIPAFSPRNVISAGPDGVPR